MVKISVIMPVFNDEEYLEEAVESVVNQTLKDVELICYNDGSTDGSLKILERLKDKYDIVKVFSQENQGVAATRNNAMKVATGEYLAFLDSDDFFIDDDALEKLYEVAEKNDANMASGNIKIWNVDGSYSPFVFLKYYEEEETILPEDYGIPFSFTKAIFKRDFLLGNEIYFPLLTKGEDPAFLAEVLSKLDYVYAVPTDVYAYRYIDGSVKYNSYKNYYDQVMHYKLVFDHMSDAKFDKYTHEFKYHLINLIDFMGPKRSKPTLKAIREVFHDDAKILRQCEEYFYFKYQKNEELSDLVELKVDPNRPRISVIVPLYNDEKKIKSLKFILNQTLEDIEVICIDNASTDDTLNLLNEIDDDRIKIFHQDEFDLADAKNRGLKEACGEFIYFYDIRNAVPKKTLEYLYKNIMFNDSDLTMAKFNSSDENLIDYNTVKFDLSKKFKVNFNKFVFRWDDDLEVILNSPSSICSKLYRKEYLDKFDDLNFDMSIAFEDILFHIKSILRANRISFTPNVTYRNKFNNQIKYYTSLISSDILDVISRVESLLDENGLGDELSDEVNLFKFIHIINHMYFTKDEEYYRLSKKELLNLDFNDYSRVNKNILARYINILKSDSLEEFREIEFKKHDLDLNKRYETLTKQQKTLTKTNKNLKKKNKDLKKLNKDILSSTSWKMTSSLRKVKNSSKK